MKIKVLVAAVSGFLLLAGVAEAHKVPYGYAKTEIRRATADLCGETTGCINWSVGPCERKSFHRVDCVAKLWGESGAKCGFVMIARAPRHLYEVRIHHKRVFCN